MSSQRTIIKFEKSADDYTILKIDSPIDLESVKDMKELTFDIDDALPRRSLKIGITEFNHTCILSVTEPA